MTLTIHFLGTGAAIPINRGLPCIALRLDSDIYLLDVGEGCQHRMFRAGLSPLKIKAIFITHLHGDHYLGLFGLFQTMHLSGREKELTIIAPQPLWKIVDSFIENKLYKPGYELVETNVGKGIVYGDSKLKIEAFPVCHSVDAYGFKIEIAKKNIVLVYTGDTRPCRYVVDSSREADLLIHEATFTSDMEKEAHEQGHSTSKDAGLIASEAGVKKLILTHISARYDDPYQLFIDAYRYYRNVIVAEDYMFLRY